MPKKILSIIGFLLFWSVNHAQIGIGTTDPQGALDINSTVDGLLIPRVALVDTETPIIDTPTESELVFNTATAGIAPNQVTPGFYFWNGTSWVKILTADASTGGWSLNGNAGTTAEDNFIGTTDDIPLNFRVNNQNAGTIKSTGATFFGYQAGNNSSGQYNSGVGYQSLQFNTTGVFNTAKGAFSLLANTSGNYNTAIGTYSLFSNTTGYQNTAVGVYSLFYNNGIYNTAIGYESLYSNTSGNYNTAIGSNSLFSNSSGYQNTASGNQALRYNTSGHNNTANGYNSLFSNTTGYQNTASGSMALLENTAGLMNSAFGYDALRNNTIGNYNTANGTGSLFLNTTGSGNTATGVASLYYNQTGGANTANGYNSLTSNTIGISNTAVGQTAMYNNTTGSRNTAIGRGSLYTITLGNENTAAGASALFYVTTGNGNTVMGYNSGSIGIPLQTGNYNTLLGYSVSTDNSARTNCIAVAGNGNLNFGGDNRARIGNNAMTSIGGQVSWTTISDQRVKDNVKNDVKGLDFILKLKPVTYNYSIAQSNLIQKLAVIEEWPSKRNIEKMRFSGFLAQEVYEIAKQVNYDFSGVDKPEDTDGLWGLRYAEFTIPLVKAVQELHEKNEEIKEQNKELQQQLNELATRLIQLEQQVKP